jgi:hypothetical protein
MPPAQPSSPNAPSASQQKVDILTPEQAESQGFRQLTYPIENVEQWIIDNVVRDMQRGGIPCVLVTQPQGLEVWRRPKCRS